MMDLNDRHWIYRKFGIDNGSNTVGLSVVETDLRTGVSTVIHGETLTADKTAYERYSGLTTSRGKMKARLKIIEEWMWEKLEEWDPDAVASESPFSHLHVQSFAVLLASQTVIDDVCYRYRKTMPFVKVPPGRAKRAVCPKGQYQNGKDVIRKYILDSDKIVAGPGVDLESFDEHAMDGTAVARYLALVAMDDFT